jgi:hypothetical protein
VTTRRQRRDGEAPTAPPGDGELPFGVGELPFGVGELPFGAGELPFRVEVVRSARRTRTASARLIDGVAEVRVPAGMAAAEERRCVDDLVARLLRRQRSDHLDLAARTEVLARRLGLPRPREVRWVDNQSQRWGSCTPATGEVRLSRRLADFPGWVVDYVIAHELAHLVEANHSPAFWALVERYPKAERARGFLIAKGLERDEERG